jgi:dTDP-4-dehydrorhamnose 3,5-epimerase-like enzyme
MNKTSIHDCQLITLPKITDSRGNISFLEEGICPFEFKRIYYLYDVPAESIRGGHAHKALRQILIPLSGSFNVLLDDGDNKKEVNLYRPYQGLLICPMIWRELNQFSSGAVCLVLASEKYDESDYFRVREDFLRAKNLIE